MEPEEVLELIRTAPRRYETVRAALRYRGDGRTMTAIEERYFRSEAYRRVLESVVRWPKEPAERPQPGASGQHPLEPFGWNCRIWHVDPATWRRESYLPGGYVHLAASTAPSRAPGWSSVPGKTWQHRVGRKRAEHNSPWFWAAEDYFWTFYPVDPFDIAGASFIGLRGLPSRVETGVARAGREAVRLTCVPDEEWHWDADPLWWGADEFELVVDAQRGVLLRTASRLGGKDIDALEIEEIHFDERFPEEVFTSREPLPWR